MRPSKPPEWRPRGFLPPRERHRRVNEWARWYAEEKVAVEAAIDEDRLPEFLEGRLHSMMAAIAKDWE